MTAFFSWQHAIRSSKLESTTKLVCYTIWSHMASDGTGCFPSYALIAEESGLSRRAVIYHVEKAAIAGFLVVDNRQRDNGSASSNLYRPTMPVPSAPVAPRGAPDAPVGSASGAPLLTDHLSNNPPNIPQPPEGAKAAADDFAKFWDAYPSKVGKPKALAVWQRLKPDLDNVLSGLKRWKASEQWRKDGGRYIPHPTTWLNREGWNDAIAGEKATVSTAELEASKRRTEQARRDHEKRMADLVESRRRQLGMTT